MTNTSSKPTTQKEFELACLFRKDMKQGSLQTREDGSYLDAKTRDLYDGY